MGAPSTVERGAVVLVRFPFSDLSASKLRPAVVLADVGRGDHLLVQVTSNPYADARAVELTDRSFKHGSLERTSYARPGKLFTANEALFARTVGQLTAPSTGEVVAGIIRLLQQA